MQIHETPGAATADHAQARRNMVDGQLRTFDVSDRALLAAMGELPRERFVPADQQGLAYLDRAVVMGRRDERGGRELLAPMVLARLIQALDIEAGAKVLDVGGGQGYSAAIFARLGAQVVALEEDPAFQEGLSAGLAAIGLSGLVTPRSGPLAAGAPDLAPFDAILVNGAVEHAPQELLSQLSSSGRLACLRTDGRVGRAAVFVRSGEAVGTRDLFDVVTPALAAFANPPAFDF